MRIECLDLAAVDRHLVVPGAVIGALSCRGARSLDSDARPPADSSKHRPWLPLAPLSDASRLAFGLAIGFAGTGIVLGEGAALARRR